ncbi:MAG: hypothetical protein HN948_02510 [Clostridia bacterium]|jgi:hypothetical protein|nr:hypothetical protein [Clostridia bacterium]MBT7121863.1 hypothetical protein [Clostridia bacterium]
MSFEKVETIYDEAFLVKTTDFIELDYITSMLREMGIAYKAVQVGAEQFVSMHSQNPAGISIYVDQNRLEEARELLTSLETQQFECDELSSDAQDAAQLREQIDDEGIGYQEKAIWRMKRGILRTVLIGAGIIIGLGLLLILIVYVYSIIQRLS